MLRSQGVSFPESESSNPSAPERVVLVGFMASGKTEVGRRLAERLGWRHVDLDREIERSAGITIGEIFRTRGEAAFRSLEAELTPEIVREPRQVVSTGGGWVTNPGILEMLPPRTLTVHLAVTVDEVLRRLGPDERRRRPLLAGDDDPRDRVASLLAAREPLYRSADLTIDTDGRSADSIAANLYRLIETATSNAPPPGATAQHGFKER